MITKICSKCKIEKDINEFHKHSRSKDGHVNWCDSCKKEYVEKSSIDKLLCKKQYRKEYRKQYCKEHASEFALYSKEINLKQYGLTMEQRDDIILEQNNECLVCGYDLRKLSSKNIHVDHDHKTNIVRGILCNRCNSALGMLNEDLQKIYKLAEYIKKYCIKDE